MLKEGKSEEEIEEELKRIVHSGGRHPTAHSRCTSKPLWRAHTQEEQVKKSDTFRHQKSVYNHAQVVNNPGNVNNDAQNVYKNPGNVNNNPKNDAQGVNTNQKSVNNKLVGIRLNSEEYERLMREAKENQMDSVSSYLKYLVRKHLHNEEEREKKKYPGSNKK